VSTGAAPSRSQRPRTLSGAALASRLEAAQAKADAYNAEQKAASDAYQKQMDNLTDEIVKENNAYEKQKDDLVASTIDKYVKLDDQVNAGWQKILDDTKLKVGQMQTLEAQALAAKAAIEAQASSTLGSSDTFQSTPLPTRAAGGPVDADTPYLIGEAGPEVFVPASAGNIISNGSFDRGPASAAGAGNISIMAGATIHIHNEADENRLTQKIATALAKTLQARQSGLATAY